MVTTRALVPLSLLALAHARPSTSNPKIQWGPCEDGEFNTTLELQCGTLRVPLDYTQPNSNQHLDLQIVKIPAPVQPSMGGIQINFGGPGAETRQSAVAAAPLLQGLSAGRFDLLAVDPRGVGKTMPFFCTEEPFLIGQMLSGFQGGNASDTELRRLWARGEVDANICRMSGNGNETGELVGTAFTARDMISVVDALDEDGMLRYWGFSYGTTLGATLAAMFPERIDKLIIDGVQNPHEYYHAWADFEEWTDTDKVLTHFFETCVEAGREKCALAALNKTAKVLEQDLWAFMESVRNAPIAGGTGVFDTFAFKSFIVGSLKAPTSWPSTAELIVALVYGPEEDRRLAAEQLVNAAIGDVLPTSLGLADKFFAIHCGDRVPRSDSFEEVAPAFELLSKNSRLEGETAHVLTTHCAQWPWRAKEVYSGNFQVHTKNPILVVSNSLDAHTPLRSAHNVSSGFAGSGFLEVNGTGHTSLAVPSVCSVRQTSAYWVNGSLPEPGKVCDDAQLWTDYSWADAFSGASSSNGTHLIKSAALSVTLGTIFGSRK